MSEDIRFKYLLKAAADRFNEDQKSLHFNKYVLKVVLIICLLTAILMAAVVICLFITPLLLSSVNKAFTTTSVITSVVMVILIILGSFIYFSVKSSKNLKNNTKIDNHFPVSGSINNTQSISAVLELEMQAKQQKKHKSAFTERLYNLFAISGELIKSLLNLFFRPVQAAETLYIDSNKINFAKWLVEELEKDANKVIPYDFVIANYKDYSQNWINSSLNALCKINLITITDIEQKGKMILLNTTFFGEIKDEFKI